MKRIGIVGLCLAAVFALSAMGASAAFASEYGVCAKASPKGTGNYEGKNCETKVAGTGKYEWVGYPGPAGTKWGYTSKGKTAVLSTVQGSITCKKNTDVGKIISATEDEDAVSFVECTNNVFGTPCYNQVGTKENKKGGTILVDDATKILDEGEVGPSGKTVGAGEEWTVFYAKAPSPYLAEFFCVTPLGEDPFFVTGSVSGVATGQLGKMSNKGEVKFAEGLGEQDLITYTAGLVSHEIEPFASVQTATAGVKYESKVEIKG